MKIVGVIPARFASTRFEGKVLADILGKPMIQHVWERVRQCDLLDEVYIACDHADVEQAALSFGAKVIMTRDDHVCGTDRIAEAMRDIEADIILNIQGDEPLIEPSVVRSLTQSLVNDAEASMATVASVIKNKADLVNPNVVKVALDVRGYAMYFSRSVIPYDRDKTDSITLKHLGLYAYRRDFLFKFLKLDKTPCETAESLEQLRALESGYKIKVIVTHHDSIGVDTPEDLVNVKNRLAGV